MSERYIKVATRAEVPSGSVKAVDADGLPIALCNVDGEFYAVHDECTHECFPLSDGMLESNVLECMLHGARFDVKTGEVLALPAYEPVETFPVKVEGDDILIGVD